MEKFEQFLESAGRIVRALLKVLPTRILLLLLGAVFAGISAKHPDWPLPTPTEFLIMLGVGITADTLRPIGSGQPSLKVTIPPLK